MSPSRPKTAADVIWYATGHLAMISCVLFIFFMVRSGFSRNATTALAVCFAASIINYYYMSSGYALFNQSSLSMAEINK